MKRLLIASAAVFAVSLGVSQGVSAQPADDKKVTICHATNSVKNPYVQNTVDDDAADGNTGNDKGQGDHSTHTGPVATSEAVAQSLKDQKKDWGDIIPPHDNYPGLNWTAEGQAVYNNGCKYVTPTTPDGNGGGSNPGRNGGASTLGSTTTNTTAAPAGTSQVGATPVAGVDAGGGYAGSVMTSLIALGASLGSLGYGAFRFRKSSL